MTDQTGVRFGLAEAALVSTLLASGLLRLEPPITLAVVTLTSVCAGALLGPLWAAGLGLSAWALFTGFAENSFGNLTFGQADVLRLGLMVAGCVGVAWFATRGQQAPA